MKAIVPIVGIGTTIPTAVLNIKAGTATANTAPLKFTSGVNLTTPEAGAVEYDGTNLFFTDSGAVRRTIATATTLGSYLPLAGGTMAGAVVSSAGTAAAPSVGVGSTSSGLFSAATDMIGLSTAGTERIRVDATGNVGIGTLSPGNLLHVNGTSQATTFITGNGTAAAPSISFASSTNTGLFKNGTAGTIYFTFAGSQNLTTNSSSLYGVNGDFKVRLSGTVSAAAPTYTFVGDATTGMFRSGVGNLAISTSSAERLRIDSTGNIGIGTTLPTAVINIKAGTAAASTAPLKFTSGPVLTTPEAGAVEYDGTNLFYTDSGAVRRTIASLTSLGSYLPLAGGTMTGTVVFKPSNVNATATVDFSTGNLQHTAASCGAFILNNMKDGGSFTFAVKGATSATCSFTAFSDAGVTGLTVHMPSDHGATTATRHTLYSFLVMGTDVYVTWLPDL